MNEEQIQDLFRNFAAPLGELVSLGARKETVEQLARSLWAALLGGPKVEDQVWQSMADTQSELLGPLQDYYQQRMKPTLGEEQLTALRQHYGIQV